MQLEYLGHPPVAAISAVAATDDLARTVNLAGTTVAANTRYVLSIASSNGFTDRDFSYVAGTGDDATAIATGLAAAIDLAEGLTVASGTTITISSGAGRTSR